MKFAYFGFPHVGGTFSVYRSLRSGLRGAGIDIRWVSAGDAAHRAAADPAWVHERRYGIVCGHFGDDEREQAEAIVRGIERGGFDGVFVNVLADRAQTNAVRYLPEPVRRIMIVHNITPATYAAAGAIRDSVHATVGVSPRIREDLVEQFGFDTQRTFVIPNATIVPEQMPEARRAGDGSLRLLSLGRIDDQAKGVLWLPAILEKLPAHVTLTIAGDGPDFPRLAERCAGLGDRVSLIGSVPPERVPGLFAAHDVLLAPSRFEGFMITLAEAMASGCVPVASHIRGVTDWVVEHGKTGLLFPIGNDSEAAACVRQLLDPNLRDAMAAAAHLAVRDRFTVQSMAASYRAVIEGTKADPPKIAEPLDLRHWQMPAGLRPGLRAYVPRPVKNLLRVMMERAAI